MSKQTFNQELAGGIAENLGLSDKKRQWIWDYLKHYNKAADEETEQPDELTRAVSALTEIAAMHMEALLAAANMGVPLSQSEGKCNGLSSPATLEDRLKRIEEWIDLWETIETGWKINKGERT